MKKHFFPASLLIVLGLILHFSSFLLSAGEIKSQNYNYLPGEVIVKFSDNSRSTLSTIKDVYGLSVRDRLFSGRIAVIRLPDYMSVEEALSSIGSERGVEYVEPNYIRRAMAIPDDPFYPSQWGLHETGMADAWDHSTGDRAVVVAVIDTGIDMTHSDLTANIWNNPGESPDGTDNDHNGLVDDIRGWDFINGDNDPSDDNGHGTHIAGIIGAVGNNGTGVSGMNWKVSLLPIKILDADGVGSVADEISAISYAVEKGVNLINASFGGSNFFSNAERDAIQSALNAGILFVAAAGNGGPDFIGDDDDAQPFYPSGYDLDNIISVTAVTRTGALATYGNFGKNTVDLGAPGDNILSTLPSTYGSLSGTSMATAFVSGLAGLLQTVYGDIDYRGIKGIILESVTPSGTLQDKTVAGGIIDGAGAVTALLSPDGLTVDEITEHTARLKWNDRSTLEEGFRIMRKAGAEDYTEAGTVGSGETEFEDSGLSDGRVYTYRVIPYNSGIGDGSPSGEVTAVTLLSAPAGLTAETLSTDSLLLRWTDNSASEDGYIIERSDGKGGFVEIARTGGNVTEFTDRDLQTATTYLYRVKAFNSVAGESAPSNEVSVKTASAGNRGSSGGGGGGCAVTEGGAGGDGGLLICLLSLMVLFRLRSRRP